MAIKNYLINDKWLDIDKQNIVEVKSSDGVIGSIKVNGEEYGGGGGSSDFSTAEVTIIGGENIPDGCKFMMPLLMDDDGYIYIDGGDAIYQGTISYTAVLYQGYTSFNTFVASNGAITTGNFTISVTGNASVMSGNFVSITGDCTITIS